VTSPPKTKKKLQKSRAPDRSQRLRRAFQLAFLGLNLWIGTQFVLFVDYYESGGRGMRVARPAGVEGWLPNQCGIRGSEKSHSRSIRSHRRQS